MTHTYAGFPLENVRALSVKSRDGPMRRWRRKEIRALALEKILKPLWHRRREFAPGAGPSPLGLLPIRPDRIITELLRLRLEEPEEIIPERGPHAKRGLPDRGPAGPRAGPDRHRG